MQRIDLPPETSRVLMQGLLNLLKEQTNTKGRFAEAQIIGIIKERAAFVSDFWELSSFFFMAPSGYVGKAAKKSWKEDTDAIMKELASIINNTESESAEHLQTIVKEWIENKGIGFGKVMQPLRLALVGDLKGPDLFQIMFMIGRDATVRRIELAIDSF